MFKVYTRAGDLPQQWDMLTNGHPFLKREMLILLEEVNPCNQSYHLNEQQKMALVIYKLQLNLFTFLKGLSFKVPANIVGVPLSVAQPGFALGDKSNYQELCRYIQSLSGPYLILNTSTNNLNLGKGDTLPSCKMAIKWNSFEQYLQNMRSHYRHRVNKAIGKFTGVQMEELQNNASFDQGMYQLYLEVYENSEAKLEKLSIDFFRRFPAKIFKFTLDQETIGFIQLVESGDELIFLLGGFNHQLNGRLDLYWNMLLEIIRYGIEGGFKQLDLGQTAEETKLKLGAVQYPMYMYGYHSNKMANLMAQKFLNKFSYQYYPIQHRVFKEAYHEGPISKMP